MYRPTTTFVNRQDFYSDTNENLDDDVIGKYELGAELKFT